jgi:hypothetical protein
MTHTEIVGLSVAQVQDMLRRELSTAKRIVYLFLLLLTVTGAGLIGSLWLTEPGPLPLRTHLAFGALVAINLAWSALFGWVVTRRKVLFAVHRVIAGWMAVVFCGIFLLLGAVIAISRGNITGLYASGLVGIVMLFIAITILKRARRRRQLLLARRNELAGLLAGQVQRSA